MPGMGFFLKSSSSFHLFMVYYSFNAFQRVVWVDHRKLKNKID